jgi:hypothetical protein
MLMPPMVLWLKQSNQITLILRLNYTGIHATGFKDFLLKPELTRSIGDCGFEHPSEGNSITRFKTPTSGGSRLKRISISLPILIFF